MAINQPELWSTTTQGNHPNFEPKEVQVCEFAANSGSEAVRTLAVGTAVAHNGTNWVYLDGADDNTNGSEQIRGFVYPDPIVLHASDTVLGQVMLAGRADYNGLTVTHDTGGTGYTEAQLITAIKGSETLPSAASRGLYVKNLADVR